MSNRREQLKTGLMQVLQVLMQVLMQVVVPLLVLVLVPLLVLGMVLGVGMVGLGSGVEVAAMMRVRVMIEHSGLDYLPSLVPPLMMIPVIFLGMGLCAVVLVVLEHNMQKGSKNLPLRIDNFVALVPIDYQAMLLDKFAALKRQKTNRFIIYILIGWEFGPLVLSNAMGSLQQIFRKYRA
jgi:hypothetical protein